MASIREIIEGLQIIAKYAENGEETQLAGADHDIIWAPLSTDAEISASDKEDLEALGWHESSETDTWARFV